MILASELTHKTLWYPTILGVLVVVAGIVLFCGTVYILLGTNLGARLGFLVSFTGLMGFMMLLSLLWCTTASPLNTLKGTLPSWKIQQVVTNLDNAKLDTARDIVSHANRVDATEASNVKAAVDAKLITVKPVGGEPVEEHVNDFAQFDEVTEYQVLQTWETGGSNPQFWKGEFTHTQKVAVAQFCATVPQDATEQAQGFAPPPAQCESDERGYVILTRDLGSVRLPPFVVFVISSILFVLGLLMLHWREKD
ncbi:MAG: hypothetical protein ABWY77_05950, partial [Acidimicrobiia bacterium]